MNILVVNDDGISAQGLTKLATLAKSLGSVWVVAPDRQCSGMSHHITPTGELILRGETQFPVANVSAWSLSGTPADCVKVALDVVMPQKPDVLLTGINLGCNAGVDILYSGTVGAAMEGVVNHIPSIAFSSIEGRDFRLIDEYLLYIARELLSQRISSSELWNVNFPKCEAGKNPQILYDCFPSYKNYYELKHEKEKTMQDGSILLQSRSKVTEKAEPGSDVDALLKGCIAVGKVGSEVLRVGRENIEK